MGPSYEKAEVDSMHISVMFSHSCLKHKTALDIHPFIEILLCERTYGRNSCRTAGSRYEYDILLINCTQLTYHRAYSLCSSFRLFINKRKLSYIFQTLNIFRLYTCFIKAFLVIYRIIIGIVNYFLQTYQLMMFYSFSGKSLPFLFPVFFLTHFYLPPIILFDNLIEMYCQQSRLI